MTREEEDNIPKAPPMGLRARYIQLSWAYVRWCVGMFVWSMLCIVYFVLTRQTEEMYIAIGLGTMFGGWRIVKTMGSGITRLNPVGGFCAETAAATTIFAATFGGVPISTTHAITGSILGVGTTRGLRSVRWIWGQRIVVAWVLTIPCAAFMAMVVYALVHWTLEPLFGSF